MALSKPDPISIIVPVLNESACIVASLQRLAAYRDCGCEIIVVDGGSTDDTQALAAPHSDKVISSAPGRGIQMNAGASSARFDKLLFLHIDTRLPADAHDDVRSVLATLASLPDNTWGYFRVSLSNPRWVYRVITWFINQRSRLSRIPTGDQAMFFGRALFEKNGGFASIPLMEDVDIAKRLRVQSPPHRLPFKVVTSSRRWEENGVIRTVIKMWQLRLLFWLGASPAELAQKY